MCRSAPLRACQAGAGSVCSKAKFLTLPASYKQCTSRHGMAKVRQTFWQNEARSIFRLYVAGGNVSRCGASSREAVSAYFAAAFSTSAVGVLPVAVAAKRRRAVLCTKQDRTGYLDQRRN
ncbi:hypothetical protein NPIL_523171 [Nephila pilipes]|uniref:Uncharacterized protein n=1 Tax=Nephila pilipes TaxID=299642 RepID=A0A8X6QZ87_NEPPI|nr:hypothetical protein NPIL_523171 [Nephila pilipes]